MKHLKTFKTCKLFIRKIRALLAKLLVSCNRTPALFAYSFVISLQNYVLSVANGLLKQLVIILRRLSPVHRAHQDTLTDSSQLLVIYTMYLLLYLMTISLFTLLYRHYSVQKAEQHHKKVVSALCIYNVQIVYISK